MQNSPSSTKVNKFHSKKGGEYELYGYPSVGRYGAVVEEQENDRGGEHAACGRQYRMDTSFKATLSTYLPDIDWQNADA